MSSYIRSLESSISVPRPKRTPEIGYAGTAIAQSIVTFAEDSPH